MTIHPTPRPHPTDVELAAWWDDPAAGDARIGAHVSGCERCRAEIRALDETRALLSAEPPMPGAAAFAAQRERILAAGSRRPRRGPVPRVAWLAPLAAAAAIAAIVLLGRPGADRNPADRPLAEADAVPRPALAADAEEAAEEAVQTVVVEEPAVVPAEPIDEELLDAALAAAEPLAPPVAFERALRTEALFAGLPEEEQSAVLVELASADLGL